MRGICLRTIPGPLSWTAIRKRSSVPATGAISTARSGEIPASSQASRELSTASLTAVRSALRGWSKPRRWRFFVKNSATEISRWRSPSSSAVTRVRGGAAGGGAFAVPSPSAASGGAAPSPPFAFFASLKSRSRVARVRAFFPLDLDGFPPSGGAFAAGFFLLGRLATTAVEDSSGNRGSPSAGRAFFKASSPGPGGPGLHRARGRASIAERSPRATGRRPRAAPRPGPWNPRPRAPERPTSPRRADVDERGPEEGVRRLDRAGPHLAPHPALRRGTAHRQLRLPEGSRRRETLGERLPIERLHRLRRRPFLHAPESRHDPARAGVEEGAGQRLHPLPPPHPAPGRLAVREHHEVGVEGQLQGVRDREEALLAAPGGERDPRALGELAVHEAVGREVEDGVRPEVAAETVGGGPRSEVEVEPAAREGYAPPRGEPLAGAERLRLAGQ